MNDGLRRRLIGGTVVVVSALVIFPLLFKGEGYRERHLPSNIPEAPALPEVVVIEPQAPALPDTSELAPPVEPRPIEPMPPAEILKEEPAPTPAPAPAPSPAKAKVAAPEPVQVPSPDLDLHQDTPVLDAQNVPVAWTLQLASFRDEANARTLRKKLVGAGYKVYTRRIGDLVKVYVGPDIQRSKLERLQAQLKGDFGLSGIIIRFTTQ